MATAEVEAVRVYKELVEILLDRAAQVKANKQIEPPLTETSLGESIWHVPDEYQGVVQGLNQQTQFAAVEIAFREKFYRILASTSIDDPAFIHIWNLLDIVSIFSDNEQCEPGLIFWLIEELLDSQTIDGCRKVFDYLESRRERNIKKHFKQKNLIILRSCNELLRRLSRAEDTVFCGRVFIFLFQSFPLGDKSSVNLRGEFHTENVTIYDEITKPTSGDFEHDTVMTDGNESSTATEDHAETRAVSENQGAVTTPEEGSKVPNVTVSAGEQDTSKDQVNLDALYPVFWNLQSYFSSPTNLFDPERFATFKAGLETTLSAFKKLKPEMEQSAARSSEEARSSHKRKRTTDGGEVGTSFNPKYLTSRDLFDLEVSDMAFRRHVLVQALILLDFMLSLTPNAKARLAGSTNKSVLYGFVLGEEDAKWVSSMRKEIGHYLQDGAIGKFYFRMVDTVLSRDKNWARWKADACPPIERPAVSLPDYMTARENAQKTYANKRLRPSPMGSLDLKFLSDNEVLANVERLKESDRFSVPAADSFMMGIMDDEMDIDMAQTPHDKEIAQTSKASKVWRILRLSAKSKFAAFDKIEDGNNLKALFESPATQLGTPQPSEGTEGTIQQHDDSPQEPKDAAPEDNEMRDAPVENKEPANVTQSEASGANEGTRDPDAPSSPVGNNAKENPAS